MSLDRLLLWLSVKGHGSWSQFRTAVEAFHAQQGEVAIDADDVGLDSASDLPIYQQVRLALQRLGHVEFFTADSKIMWRVVPPTIATRDEETAEGLLCGARSPVLLESLIATTDLAVESYSGSGMPERITVRGASCDVLVRRAQELGFLVQKAAPASLLSALPSVRDRSNWRVSKMPATPGWLVHRFSNYPESRWMEFPPVDAHQSWTGFFRFTMKYQRFYYLRWKGCTFSVPVQVGKYAVMRRRRGTLRYDSERRTLSVLATLRPPLLMERALVLCSGVLPYFDSTTCRLEYTNVRGDVALLAAQLLNQEINIG